jgi:hypothetical protein
MTQIILVVFALLLLGTFATKCRAESVMQFELGSTVSRGVTPALGLTVVWLDAGPGDSDFQCGIELVGTSEHTQENPNQAAVQCLIVDGYKKFDLGIGVVALQNTDEFNGSHTNFSLMAGYRFTDHLGLIYRHWSNAGTIKPNTGRDMLLVTYRF